MSTRIGFVSTFFLITVSSLAQFGPQQPAMDYDPSLAQQNQGQGLAPDQVDPEDRNHGVGRISLLNGDVSVRRGDSGDQVAAAMNAPLLAQDSLIVGPSSRAEIQLDTANRVRFANDTEVRLALLTADRFQIQMARGTLTWAVLGEGNSQGEIATPSVGIRPLGRGDFRVSVLPDGTTQITARSGVLEIAGPRGVERLSTGQTMMARGAADNPEFQTVGAIGRDEWDIFNERRDSELQQSQSYNYVSRDIAGAEDLDNYGQWNSDPTYGQVWTPRVSADWAPYRLGRWGYEDYYGWTWISSDPWGWAPYHYGSWFRGNYGWSWYPGGRYSRHYYRPALVAFFGYGSGSGFGGRWGFGNVGWVPLAPYERYNRWYGRGFSGYGNFGRNGNVLGSFRNARVNNGVTSLNSRDFAAGHFGRYSSPGAGQLQQAGFSGSGVPFTPTNNHFRFNDRQTNVQSRTNFNQMRFASGTAQRQNFQGQPQSFGRQGSDTSRQNYAQNPGSNWQRFGTPGQQQQNRSFFNNRPSQSQTYGGGTSPTSNWQRFGNPGAGSTRQNYAPQTQSSTFSRFGDYRRFDSGQSPSRYGSQSVQVAPPVVRNRPQEYRSNQPSQPDYGRQQRQQSGGGFSNRPSYSQPSRQENSRQGSFQGSRSEGSRQQSGNNSHNDRRR